MRVCVVLLHVYFRLNVISYLHLCICFDIACVHIRELLCAITCVLMLERNIVFASVLVF